MNDGDPPLSGSKPRIPTTVIALGFVSMFMDISSEIVHSLLPAFLTTVLGVTALTVGIIEGIAEGTATITKVFSGILSDYFRKRKPLALLGYGLAALTKPLFPIAQSVHLVITARFLDRIGKGIRGAPRDALVADVTPIAQRGAAYGIRQSLDTVGAFLGPLLAIGLMLLFKGSLRSVLWFAVLPAAIAVVILFLAVHEPAPQKTKQSKRFHLRLSNLRDMGKPFWGLVVIGGLFALARFSEAFLVLRALDTGISTTMVPIVMVVMSLLYSLSAWPVGKLSDRLPRHWFLVIGLALLILADIILAKASTPILTLLGSGFWGLHMGFSHGTLTTLIADTSTSELRGTAFGIFNLFFGLCTLLASFLAGFIWVQWGPAYTFAISGILAFLALLAILVQQRFRSVQPL